MGFPSKTKGKATKKFVRLERDTLHNVLIIFILPKFIIKKAVSQRGSLGKLLIQSLEWLSHDFCGTHNFTDHVKKNWKNPFCNMRTSC